MGSKEDWQGSEGRREGSSEVHERKTMEGEHGGRTWREKAEGEVGNERKEEWK